MAGAPKKQARRRETLGAVPRQDPKELGDAWEEMHGLMNLGIVEMKRRFELAYQNTTSDYEFVRLFREVTNWMIQVDAKNSIPRPKVMKIVQQLGASVNKHVREPEVREAIRTEWERTLEAVR